MREGEVGKSGGRRKRKNGGGAERGKKKGRMDKEGEHVHAEEQERLRECKLKTEQMSQSDHGKAGYYTRGER